MRGKDAFFVTLVLGFCLILGALSADAKVSGVGLFDMGMSLVDRDSSFEYYNALAGDGRLDLGWGRERQNSGNFEGSGEGRSHSTSNEEANIGHPAMSTNIAYSGDVPLVGLKMIRSKSFYGGTDTMIQESFSVNQLEAQQTSYRDPDSQFIGSENKISFNGTWETVTSSHETFYRDIKSLQRYSGDFEIQKQIMLGSPTSPEPSMSLVVTPSQSLALIGENITRDYVITNTGRVPILELRLVDSRLGPVSMDKTYLNPGATATGKACYTLTEDDLLAQNDTVQAWGSDIEGNVVVSYADLSAFPVSLEPGLSSEPADLALLEEVGNVTTNHAASESEISEMKTEGGPV